MKWRKEIAAFAAALLLFLCLSWGAGALLRPDRANYGSTWQRYLREEHNSVDVLFLGSSLVYCDVAPAWLWAESGVRSYVMAGPEQTVPLSYYYLREACRTQSPKLAVLELTGMFYEKYQNYTKVNVDYMPLGWNRVAATFRAAEPSLRTDLLYPLFSYHDRWTSVTNSELTQAISQTADPLAGYTFLEKACAAPTVREREDFSAGTDTYRENLRWLEKIKAYCEKQGIELLLYIAPCASRIPETEMKTLRADVSALGLPLLECADALPEMQIDDGSDWYDYLHFNVRGAEKFSRWFGAYLAAHYDLPANGDSDAAWAERLRTLEAMKEKVQAA